MFPRIRNWTSIDLTFPVELRTCLDRLHRLGKPSSIYSFIMKLVCAVKDKDINASTAVQIIDVIECFLFRRAICGIEPTGLHAVFKTLWSELTEDPDALGLTPEATYNAISGKPTIAWPSDEEFERHIRKGNLYNRKNCSICT